MKLTDSEWAVLEVLWSGRSFSLSEIVKALKPLKKWSKTTVYTYLTRMEAKGLVSINHEDSRPYSAAVSRENCARQEREELLNKVYDGAAGDLIAAFLRDSSISQKEIRRLRKILDDMEV